VKASTGKMALKPGESTALTITFDPQQRSGTHQKALTVYSNDPQNPVVRIMLGAYVN
jgi:hypothetical protein